MRRASKREKRNSNPEVSFLKAAEDHEQVESWISRSLAGVCHKTLNFFCKL